MYNLLLNWLSNDIFKLDEVTGNLTLFGVSFCNGDWVATTFNNQTFLTSICQIGATALTAGFIFLIFWLCYKIIKFFGGLMTL